MSASLPSSPSSSHQRKFKHGIFLSYNGKDTRKSFTDHLYSALTRWGIPTFRDDKSLERGEDFEPELLRAIKESWGSIIVISERYAFSHWCLDELVEILKQRKGRGYRVYPIFYHVEPSDFRHQLNGVKEAFDKHEKRYNEKTTQGWRFALQEVTAINGWPLRDQYESVFIEDIVKDVSQKIDAEILDEQEVETMKSTFQMIQAWLVDIENKQYIKQGEALKLWLDKLKHIAYDMDDVLDEWNTAILKLKIEKDQAQTPATPSSSMSQVHNSPSTFHSGGISVCHDIAFRIKELNRKSQAIVRQKDDFAFALGLSNSCTSDLKLERQKSVSLFDESLVYGRDHEKDALIHLLLSDENSEGGSGQGVPLLAIVGMGGLGKTTLARLAYNNDEVKKHFHQRIWVCVSDPFDEVMIAKAILEGLTGIPSNYTRLEKLLQEIDKNIEGKRFLLVLDDVWTEDEEKWEPLKLSLCSGSQESRILLTTRIERVAGILGCTRPFFLGVLPYEDGWSLFIKIAFFRRSYQDCENLASIGRKCVEKCKGLPLAIKTLASLLRFKSTREQWQSILDSPMWQLDKVENDIFSPFLLSYYDLTPQLRQCFAYCAIFPKDYRIEKDLLINLWMAQGFIGETQGKEMEMVGEEYFENLAMRSFFHELEKDADDNTIIIRCKMHDVMHDFAQFLRKTECCLIARDGTGEQRADSYHENVRHLTLIHPSDYIRIQDFTYNVKKLRSLLLFSNTSSLEARLPKLLDQLTCLRMLGMLNLSHRSIRELPQEIGKLIHLRYLSLEGNVELFKLPEAVGDLYNLQTLNIQRCPALQKLPLGIERLINLRHLQNAHAKRGLLIPKGVRRLTCLQTLEWLVAVKTEAFSLADLGKLIHLRGFLYIGGLGNVGEAEAREARLSTKVGLRELILYFDGGFDKEPQTSMEDNAFVVLEALQPPQHLQCLDIRCCKSPTYPSWMMSLTWLKSVRLYNCPNWKSLPPIGKLPSLESLSINGVRKVKKVGEEFLGVETSSSFVDHNIIAFPNLKTLRFEFMAEWEEWKYGKVWRSIARGGADSSSSSSSMPQLQRLSIKFCAKLKTLPRHLLQSGTLQELKITGSPILCRRFNEETGEDWPSISHIPEVQLTQ